MRTTDLIALLKVADPTGVPQVGGIAARTAYKH